MGKYTNKQLKDMAIEVLEAKGNGNINYHMLLQTLSVGLGMPPQAVLQEIGRLARLEE